MPVARASYRPAAARGQTRETQKSGARTPETNCPCGELGAARGPSATPECSRALGAMRAKLRREWCVHVAAPNTLRAIAATLVGLRVGYDTGTTTVAIHVPTEASSCPQDVAVPGRVGGVDVAGRRRERPGAGEVAGRRGTQREQRAGEMRFKIF